MAKHIRDMSDDEFLAELRKAFLAYAVAIMPKKTLADIRKAIEDAQKDPGHEIPKR